VIELFPLNEGLHRRGIRLTIQQVKDSLWLRGTLPQPDGSRKQQRLRLGLKATAASLVEAEARAVALDSGNRLPSRRNRIHQKNGGGVD
jgi:hypothetical protein